MRNPLRANNLALLLWAALFLPLLSACGRNDHVAYSSFVDIGSRGWPSTELCVYATALEDSALFRNPRARYDMILAIRHTGDCPYAELFLPVSQPVVGSPQLPDTLRIPLARRDGTWLGRSSKGVYTLTDTLCRDVPLPLLYSLTLGQAMPTPYLTGLLSVGLVIERTN